MNDLMKVTMGLAKPEQEPQGTDDMRREIERGQRDSSLIRNCLMSARHQGMSGEDTYALLAYHALRMLEDIYARQLLLMPATVMMPAKAPTSP